ncbi:dicarboxylate/amino acid:cation symporter [Candidatus Cetobacterium colombiensis]|uniref:Dicarboxylate/amino acid:cation symporter n=1 Tax=Candidatus Cetobacterium colombiensis TaxID=3073100 RepID=A0ABU4W9U3_9FUSO|nr:dicarboxylate/amino acid:cation symporter [Candidatus Cetobacterium colombiensis]MDX8335346.1 dicarboxylate/amino acid:cation symporter [Candidatus Cetobacterium colombiensis]
MKQNSLTKKIFMALILGITMGVISLFVRENLIASGNNETWNLINSILFQDITASEGAKSFGLFYIIGQLFINSLQLVIIPMVFTSIIIAVTNIKDSKSLKRISYKTFLGFGSSSILALVYASFVGMIAYKSNLFSVAINNVSVAGGATSSNPLLILIKAIPQNILAGLSNNANVLVAVFLGISIGLVLNFMDDENSVIKKGIVEINKISQIFLTFIINKFAPIAIFSLLIRTFAIYGIGYLRIASIYFILTSITLIVFLILGYSFIIWAFTGLNPVHFMKKISNVAMFAFSTSSSAASLPLNTKTTMEKLGVDEVTTSFVLPMGMTVNMNGTAIMQVLATLFIAGVSGYEITIFNLATISLLALLASIGTPAAPGSGAIILFTILTGMGYSNEVAVSAYAIILGINRPLEMLLTSLNVVGDSAVAVYVSKSEGKLDHDVYHLVEEKKIKA